MCIMQIISLRLIMTFANFNIQIEYYIMYIEHGIDISFKRLEQLKQSGVII